MSVFEMAKKYYPNLWGKHRLIALVEANKLTIEEYDEIIGEEDSQQSSDQ